jgi:pyruvate dehydrogenase E2 component (dihydrolipoamide acetyltransferase)
MAAFQFTLPDIGEGVHEGEIVAWLVQPGDAVVEDQPLMEVMTDKVTAEIPSPQAGRIAQLHGKVGDVVEVGAVVVTFEPNEGDLSLTISQGVKPSEAETSLSSVAQEQPLVASSPQQGLPPVSHVLATPATRKLARTLGIDLNVVKGTGEGGRVTVQDVQQAAELNQSSPSTDINGRQPIEPAPSFVPPPQDMKPLSPSQEAVVTSDAQQPVRPMSDTPAKGVLPFVGVRRKIAQHLTHAKQTAPHFGYVDEVDMTAIVALRQQLKPQAEADQVKLHFLPFVMMAACRALKAHPVLNSTLDEANGQIILHDAINLGFAVAAEQGLVVPVIHRADTMSLKQLAQQIDTLATKARAGMLARDEVQGGTFTLTSIGSIGGLFGLPIINVPEVAIVGINKIQRRPVVSVDAATGEEAIVIRDMMYLSISCDHRVVDGADAARFMNTLITQLQTPGLWLY